MKYDRVVEKEVAAGYPQEGESVLCAGRRQEALVVVVVIGRTRGDGTWIPAPTLPESSLS